MKIYEIDNNLYIKMINYYCEVKIKNGEVKTVTNPKRIYFTSIDAKKVKSYTLEEYSKKKEAEKMKTKEF